MEIKDILNQNLNDKELLEILKDMHAFDIAQSFSLLEEDDINRIKNLLPPELLADVYSYLNPEDAAEILQTQTLDEQIEVISNLEPDDAADIINEFEEEEKEELMDALKDEDILSLMQYEEETAGSYMTNDILFVNQIESVKEATKKLIKKANELKSIKTVFVVDKEESYIGQISLQSLLRAKEPLTVNDLYETEPVLNEHDDVDTIIKHIKHYGAYDIPIVSEKNKLLGAITTDDILDIYRDETVEDIEKLNILPDTDLDQNVFISSFKRLPWLLILMLLSIPLAFITSNYEEILTSIVILAFFQPLMLDSGGDVASQTLAVTLVGLTSKEGVDIKDGIKEIISGTISGLVMGILAFIATLGLSQFMQVDSPLLVALVVGISLWLTVISAPILGFFIPNLLHKLNFDPAVASGPFITTLIDIISIVIYFGLATLLLGGSINV